MAPASLTALAKCAANSNSVVCALTTSRVCFCRQVNPLVFAAHYGLPALTRYLIEQADVPVDEADANGNTGQHCLFDSVCSPLLFAAAALMHAAVYFISCISVLLE